MFFTLFLFSLFGVGVGWWAFGQWLRSRGHGNTLNDLGEKVELKQEKVSLFIRGKIVKKRQDK